MTEQSAQPDAQQTLVKDADMLVRQLREKRFVTELYNDGEFSRTDVGQWMQTAAQYLLALSDELREHLLARPPAGQPENMSRDEMLAYYSQYANLQSTEALQYQKRIRELEARLAATRPPAGQKPVASDKFDDVLLPFLSLMRKELHANTGKGDRPGWLAMDANTALLEVYWHAAKLSAAVKNNDGPAIMEHSADVANMAMMVLDVCGGLAWVDAASPPRQHRGNARGAGRNADEAARHAVGKRRRREQIPRRHCQAGSSTQGEAVSKFTKFDYLLNSLEAAGRKDRPSDHAYGAKRQTLFAYVRALEAVAKAAQKWQRDKDPAGKNYEDLCAALALLEKQG